MPFVKLDCGLPNSTLWQDTDGTIIFISALCMAEPREFEESVAQIMTRSLELTGWAAPAGWYGFVPAAGAGIARTAGMELERGLAALERLAAPDAQSRSQEHDGRRLIRVNGGFLVLNFQRYRDRDYTTAERSKRYRERHSSRRDVTAQHRDITQAEYRSRVQRTEALESEEREKSAIARTESFSAERPMSWQGYTAESYKISAWLRKQPKQSGEAFEAAFESEFQKSWTVWNEIKRLMERSIPEPCQDGNHTLDAGGNFCKYCPFQGAGEMAGVVS